MKKLPLFVLLLWALGTVAQPGSKNKCPFFETYIQKGDAELKKGSNAYFEAAINAYSTAMVHCPDSAEVARKKILEVFEAIERLRNEAQVREYQAIKNKVIIERLSEEKDRKIIEADSAKNHAIALKDSLKQILSYFPFFKNKVAWAYNKEKGKFGLIDSSGIPKTEFIYELATTFNERNDICITSRSGKKILLSLEGKEVSEGEGYIIIEHLRDNRYRADNGYLIQLIDSSSFWYFDSVIDISQGLYKVKRQNKWNLINDANKLLLPVEVDEVGEFSENLLRIKCENGWYYLDTNLNRIDDKYFLLASDFRGGEAIVIYEGQLKKLTNNFQMRDLARQQTILQLGDIDSLSYPDDEDNFFLSINGEQFISVPEYSFKLRDENGFRILNKVPGSDVFAIQNLMNFLGFMPHIRNKGVFDYYTQASVRLLQENIRTTLNNSNFRPDGYVAPATYSNIVNTNFSAWDTLAKKQSVEYNSWFKFLEEAKQYYTVYPTPVLEQLNRVNPNSSDTRKAVDWQFNPAEVHLIGIRRKADQLASGGRENDDIFILLINGLVFKFWGSTDPNPLLESRKDWAMAFLSEGQHKYKIEWYQLRNRDKLHLGLYVASLGVLVLRDRNLNTALDSSDIQKGFDEYPNRINFFQWSGNGRVNWSGINQVIAGGSYINNYDKVIDCSAFAASSYSELGQGKTKAAYNIFMDLILTYSKQGRNSTVYYTLIQEDIFEKIRPMWGNNYAETLLNRMKNAIMSDK